MNKTRRQRLVKLRFRAEILEQTTVTQTTIEQQARLPKGKINRFKCFAQVKQRQRIAKIPKSVYDLFFSTVQFHMHSMFTRSTKCVHRDAQMRRFFSL
jgi:hypothetical protein